MPTPKHPETGGNSTMASRKAERERREAAGEIEPAQLHEPRGTYRAGLDAPQPLLVVTHVRA